MHHNLGTVLEIDETPLKRVSWWGLLPIAFICGLIFLIPFMGLAVVGCPITYQFLGKEYAEKIFVCEVFTATDSTPTIIKSALFCQTIYFAGLVWATRRKLRTLKYSEKTVIFEHGFHSVRFIASPTDPDYIFKDVAHEVVCKYSDISSACITISDKLNPKIVGRAEVGLLSTTKLKIAGNDDCIICYTLLNTKNNKRVKNREKYTFFSSSTKLAKMALSSLETRLWSEIESKIHRGERVNFGELHVFKDYLFHVVKEFSFIGKRDFKNKFLVTEIQEVLLEYDDGEFSGWDFSIRLKAELGRKPRHYLNVDMDHVENTHLFLKTLAMIGIPSNLKNIENIGLDEEKVALLKGYANLP
jgi:hypothetical protein